MKIPGSAEPGFFCNKSVHLLYDASFLNIKYIFLYFL